MKIYIYSLQDPITQEIRYVGKTKNPKMRFHNHMNTRHNEHTHKRNWINSLKELHLRPCMLILDEVSEDDWKFWEKYWIQQCIVWGFNLVNHTSGGEGSISGNSTSFKKGQVSWNKGILKERLCIECGSTFKPHTNKSKQNYCSYLCAAKNRVSETRFEKGCISWNKGTSGYKIFGLKTSIRVEQYSLQGDYINTFEGCKEAGLAMNCIPENIRRNCVGLSKSAKGFIWKYKE